MLPGIQADSYLSTGCCSVEHRPLLLNTSPFWYCAIRHPAHNKNLFHTSGYWRIACGKQLLQRLFDFAFPRENTV
jgi:hypothetical protein